MKLDALQFIKMYVNFWRSESTMHLLAFQKLKFSSAVHASILLGDYSDDHVFVQGIQGINCHIYTNQNKR